MITKLKVILEGDLAMFSKEISRALGHKESYLIKLAYSQWLKQIEAGIEELKKNEAASVSEESGVLVIEEQPDAP